MLKGISQGLHTYTCPLENGGRSLWWEQAGAFRPHLILAGEVKGQVWSPLLLSFRRLGCAITTPTGFL